MIEFNDVTKVFTNKKQQVMALQNIDLHIQQGDIFGVIGYSGAGKSTLLRLVNALEIPTTGEVLVQGKNLARLSKKELRQEQKKIGMIFQHFNLLQSRNVYENIALPLELEQQSKVDIDRKVKEALAFVNLTDKAQHFPEQLSGGQKQRVGIARALVTNPELLLCDEATSALDPQTTIAILQLLKRVNKVFGITILLITHEMEVIKEICNRVAVMEEGAIIETGQVFDVFAQPKKATTKQFAQMIVRDNVPVVIRELLSANRYQGRVFHFKFLGDSTGKPIISHIAKHYEVDLTILFGNIMEIQSTFFGHLMVEMIGDDVEIAKVLQFAEQSQVNIQEVS